jgi:beta-glucanase (GH16 family)
MIQQRKSSRRSPPKAVFISILVSFLLGSCSSVTDSTTKPIPTAISGSSTASTSGSGSAWVLAWEDNFKGTGPPPGWTFDIGGYGFGDKQLEWNSDDNAQMSQQGGLTITATKGGGGHDCWYGLCEYEGAKIQTSFSQTYGRFDARIKLPAGKGLWPAFWMIPAADATTPKVPGEIDIMETPNLSPYLVKGYAHDSDVFDYGAEKVLNFPVSIQFHTFGIDWTSSGITWTLDGKPYGHIKSYPNWPFDKPFIMLLDLEVGGSWPGPPNASTVFPARMQVSWVRVYKWAGLCPDFITVAGDRPGRSGVSCKFADEIREI